MYSDDFLNFEPYDYYIWDKYLYEHIDSFKKEFHSAIKRDIVSRLYYSIYLEVRNYARTCNGYKIPNYWEHKYLHDFVTSRLIFGKNDSASVASVLFVLKMNRVQCDYEFMKPSKNTYMNWSNKTLEELVRYCECVFDIVNEHKQYI